MRRLLGLCSGTKVTGGKAVSGMNLACANWVGQAPRLVVHYRRTLADVGAPGQGRHIRNP